MKFLISMTDVEADLDALPPEEWERLGRCHDEFQRALGDRFVGCYGAMPSAEARTIRMAPDGTIETREGPIADVPEPLGGFYIIEAGSMEEAVEWAEKGRFRPGANEVRPLRDD